MWFGRRRRDRFGTRVGASTTSALALASQSGHASLGTDERHVPVSPDPGRQRCPEHPFGDRREAYLSAQQPPSSPQARLSRPHEHPCRSCRVEVPPRQGPRPTLGLIDRIRHRDAFARLRRTGVRVRVDPLWCSFVPDPDVVPPQLAFAIGRAFGSAVERNRLRRRLRAILETCELPPGLWLIGATPRAGEHSFAQLQETVRSLVLAAGRRVEPTS
jgi:ribonuclease P protein component